MLTWEQLEALPQPLPGAARIAYGGAPQQFGELWLPGATTTAPGGLFPVVVLVHGGCWRNRYGLDYMDRLAAWLAQQGWAVWNIEYRRLGDAGGGWPGTLADAALATDALRQLAQTAPLDLGRVVAAGHSAGGQLALWLATRPQLVATSPLHTADPLPLQGVLGLAAICDLDTFRIGPPGTCHAAVDVLLQGTPAAVPARYAEASPLLRLPAGVRQAFVHGELDDTVDVASVRGYVDAAARAGDPVRLWELHDAGHFDVVVAGTVSTDALTAALRWLTS